MGKLFLPVLFSLLSFSAPAQTVCILADFTADTAVTRQSHLRSSENVLGTHSEAGLKPGLERKVRTATGRSDSWLTALYLRPVEKQAANSTAWPLVPALLLEGPPTHSVSTSAGPRMVRQLRKGDLLYRYEPATRQVSVWEVRIIQRKARRAEPPYSLVTENDGFLSENRVAMDQ